MQYLDTNLVELHYQMPLNEIIYDFFDALKANTKGYASLDYELSGYRPSELVKVDMKLNGDTVDALSFIAHRGQGVSPGPPAVREAEGEHPPAAVRGAGPGGHWRPGHRPGDRQGYAEGCAGQVLRRRHHPQEEAAGKAEGGQEKMRSLGSVQIPTEAFLAVLKLDEKPPSPPPSFFTQGPPGRAGGAALLRGGGLLPLFLGLNVTWGQETGGGGGAAPPPPPAARPRSPHPTPPHRPSPLPPSPSLMLLQARFAGNRLWCCALIEQQSGGVEKRSTPFLCFRRKSGVRGGFPRMLEPSAGFPWARIRPKAGAHKKIERGRDHEKEDGMFTGLDGAAECADRLRRRLSGGCLRHVAAGDP